jgi:hypothetical protein
MPTPLEKGAPNEGPIVWSIAVLPNNFPDKLKF